MENKLMRNKRATPQSSKMYQANHKRSRKRIASTPTQVTSFPKCLKKKLTNWEKNMPTTKQSWRTTEIRE